MHVEHTSVQKAPNLTVEVNLSGMEFVAKASCATNAIDARDARPRPLNAGMTTIASGVVTRALWDWQDFTRRSKS